MLRFLLSHHEAPRPLLSFGYRAMLAVTALGLLSYAFRVLTENA